MERIKQALQKARQERQQRQGAGAASEHVQMSEREPQTPLVTKSINLDESVLADNRIIIGMQAGQYTESFNLLRTQVLQRAAENNWSVLAVTSPRAGEGKTLTAINLAISIAREVDYTVLLVDANLRAPWMLEYFGIKQQQGLSDYLTDDTAIQEVLLKPEQIEHLVILPGGRPLINSAEMLSSPKMGQLIKEIKSNNPGRIIIFDLPPVLTSADALAFSPYIDAALLVIEEGVTQKEDVEHALDLLQSTNVIGTVLNKAEVKDG